MSRLAGDDEAYEPMSSHETYHELLHEESAHECPFCAKRYFCLLLARASDPPSTTQDNRNISVRACRAPDILNTTPIACCPSLGEQSLMEKAFLVHTFGIRMCESSLYSRENKEQWQQKHSCKRLLKKSRPPTTRRPSR